MRGTDLIQNKSRNTVLDVLKGIGIISMVMGHANMGGLFETYIAGFHMQLFFIVSGYLFRPEKYSTFYGYLKRKITSIIVPYFFFAALTVVSCEIINVIRGERVYFWNQYLLGILWGNQAIFPITGAIWFLQCIFWVEIGYYLIQRIKSKPTHSIVIATILGISVILNLKHISLPFSLDSALSGIVFYHIGQLLSTHKSSVRIKVLWNPRFFVWFVVFGINTLLIFLNGPVNPRTCEYSIVPLYYLNAIVGTWVWYCIASALNKRQAGILKKCVSAIRYIGKNSIVFLGLNQLIIKGLFVLISSVIPIELAAVRACRNILIFIITTILCAVISQVMNQTSLSVFIGKRRENSP